MGAVILCASIEVRVEEVKHVVVDMGGVRVSMDASQALDMAQCLVRCANDILGIENETF